MLTPADIRAELARRGISARDIARRLGVAPSTVTRTINGQTRKPNPVIIAEIARSIGVSPEMIQPSRVSMKKTISRSANSATSKRERVWTSKAALIDGNAANNESNIQMVQENTHKLTKPAARRVA